MGSGSLYKVLLYIICWQASRLLDLKLFRLEAILRALQILDHQLRAKLLPQPFGTFTFLEYQLCQSIILDPFVKRQAVI